MAALSQAQLAAAPLAATLAGIASSAPGPADTDVQSVDPAALASLTRLLQVWPCSWGCSMCSSVLGAIVMLWCQAKEPSAMVLSNKLRVSVGVGVVLMEDSRLTEDWPPSEKRGHWCLATLRS